MKRLSENGDRPIGVSRNNGYDLEDPRSLDELQPASWIVHLAGRVGVPESWNDPAGFYRTNISTTLTVAEYARRTGARVLLLSSYLYGKPKYLPVDETHPLQPSSPYARSKAASEEVLKGFAADYSIPAVILRLFNVYGPGQPETQVIPHIVSQAVRDTSISVRDLTPKRDYVWIGDLIDAIEGVMRAGVEGCETYNVGSGVSHSVQDIIDRVTDIVGAREISSADKERRNEIPDCYADSRKLNALTGWAATTDIGRGLAALLENQPRGRN